jgi:YVTN family beta-propeller protein
MPTFEAKPNGVEVNMSAVVESRLVRRSKRLIVAAVIAGVLPLGLAVIAPGTAFASAPTVTPTLVASPWVPSNSDYSRGVAITPVPITPNGASSAGYYAYVVDTGANAVNVINTADNSVLATIPVSNTPWNIAITPDGAYAIVTNQSTTIDDQISVIDTATGVDTDYSLGAGPSFQTGDISIGISPVPITPPGATAAGYYAYVVNYSGQNQNTISVIDPATGPVDTFSAGAGCLGTYGPVGSVVSADGSDLFLSCTGAASPATDYISEFSTATDAPVGSVVSVPTTGSSIAIDGGDLWIGTVDQTVFPQTASITILDASTLTAVGDPVALDGAAAVAFDSNGYAYVESNEGGNSEVQVLSTADAESSNTATQAGALLTTMSLSNYQQGAQDVAVTPAPISPTQSSDPSNYYLYVAAAGQTGIPEVFVYEAP